MLPFLIPAILSNRYTLTPWPAAISYYIYNAVIVSIGHILPCHEYMIRIYFDLAILPIRYTFNPALLFHRVILCPCTYSLPGIVCPLLWVWVIPKNAKRVPLCYACSTNKDHFKGLRCSVSLLRGFRHFKCSNLYFINVFHDPAVCFILYFTFGDILK